MNIVTMVTLSHYPPLLHDGLNDMVSFEYASQPWPGVYSNRQAVAVLESINKCC